MVETPILGNLTDWKGVKFYLMDRKGSFHHLLPFIAGEGDDAVPGKMTRTNKD